MTVFTCTLLADGSSDRVLENILSWLVQEHHPGPFRWHFAAELPDQPRTLDDRITSALANYPCDVLFVHRDAEAMPFAQRHEEISSAWNVHDRQGHLIRVVPVRMTEAWLLLDEASVRRAAGNPAGRVALGLPPAARIENLPDPKRDLFQALRLACGLNGRRLQKFNPEQARHRVSELADDFTVLRLLPSFQNLEAQVQNLFTAP
jgi:hypothetical protein